MAPMPAPSAIPQPTPTASHTARSPLATPIPTPTRAPATNPIATPTANLLVFFTFILIPLAPSAVQDMAAQRFSIRHPLLRLCPMEWLRCSGEAREKPLYYRAILAIRSCYSQRRSHRLTGASVSPLNNCGQTLSGHPTSEQISLFIWSHGQRGISQYRR